VHFLHDKTHQRDESFGQFRNNNCYFSTMAMPRNSGLAHLRDIEWRQPSVIALVLANLVPVFGVLVWHWEVFPLMFLFWSENLIVGAFNVLKMLTANPSSPISWIGKIFIIPFFCIHYGMFTFVHGMLVVSIFGGHLKNSPGLFNFGPFWQVMRENDLGWAVLGLAVSRGVSFFANYIGKGEYQRASLNQLMSQPYGRIFVMHFTVLIGGVMTMALHSPVAGLILLVVLKTAFDLNSHVGERKKFAEISSTAAAANLIYANARPVDRPDGSAGAPPASR
jgi:hypothetical protein